MGSLYKRADRSNYYIAYIGPDGRQKTEKAGPDRRSAEQLLAKREKAMARREAGLVDSFEESRKTPLLQHVIAFTTHLESRGRTPKHVRQSRARLEASFVSMRATTIDELTQAKADSMLAGLLRNGRACKTRDDVAHLLNQFGTWMLDEERWAVNPFRKLGSVRTEASATFERRPLSAEEAGRLVEAAETRPVQEYARTHVGSAGDVLARLARQGRHRGLLYQFAAYTGFRLSECKAVRWCDLVLTGKDPVVTIEARAAKNRRRMSVPLVGWLAKLLDEERRERAKDLRRPVRGQEPAFAVPKNIVERLRADAVFAGIGMHDEHGRRVDFHAFRTSCATMLARAGVHVSVAQRILRHADVRQTLKAYTKTDPSDLRRGIELMPSPMGSLDDQNPERSGDSSGSTTAVLDASVVTPAGASWKKREGQKAQEVAS